MSVDTERLRETVQHNCHIADARHAADYTLCVYLLKMRELYRWEKGYPFGQPMPSEDVGEWLTSREALWERLESEPYRPLDIAGHEIPPFESEAVNAHLLDHGLVYSGGLGRRAAAHFFLGELEREERHGDFRILVVGREHARDLTAPPAMAQGRTIYLRRESLKRMIWEKLQEWRWHEYDNAMKQALSFYPFDADLDRALEAMAQAEMPNVIRHEIGEIEAGRLLGPEWEEMLLALAPSRAELIARAARDHLADALVTLPALLEEDNAPSLHFYMANLTAMRRDLFPGFVTGYRTWAESGDTGPLRGLVARAADHWRETALGILERWRARGTEAAPEIERYAETRRLER
jgi:hypothetical protein